MNGKQTFMLSFPNRLNSVDLCYGRSSFSCDTCQEILIRSSFSDSFVILLVVIMSARTKLNSSPEIQRLNNGLVVFYDSVRASDRIPQNVLVCIDDVVYGLTLIDSFFKYFIEMFFCFQRYVQTNPWIFQYDLIIILSNLPVIEVFELFTAVLFFLTVIGKETCSMLDMGYRLSCRKDRICHYLSCSSF